MTDEPHLSGHNFFPSLLSLRQEGKGLIVTPMISHHHPLQGTLAKHSRGHSWSLLVSVSTMK